VGIRSVQIEADKVDLLRRSGTLANGGGRPSAQSRACPLTARCARDNEASGGALGGTEAAGATVDAASRVQPGRFVIDRGRPSWDPNGPPPSVHNVTPEEDYRTALLSDSPDAGCSLSHHGGGETAKRPGRQAGLRYSAGRAPGGCGRFILGELVAITGQAGAVARTRTRDGRPSGRRSRGKHPISRPSVRSPRTGGPLIVGKETKQTTTEQHTVGPEMCAVAQT